MYSFFFFKQRRAYEFRRSAWSSAVCSPICIKLHLLHVLRGTDLAADYAAGKFEVLTLEHYIDLLEQCLCVLPPEVVIHRLTGDGAKRDLIAPLWSADKKRVLNAIHAAFARDDLLQGSEL